MQRDDEQMKWMTWQNAQDRADAMWANPKSTAQECQAASWEACCAEQQWSDAADRKMASRAA